MILCRAVCVTVFITVIFFLTADFMLTALHLDPISKKKDVRTFVTGQRHPVYHHDLKTNLVAEASWGDNYYTLCTNEYGFKIACADAGKKANKSYDIAFMGDSFTEGVGMHYEDSFVGLFAKNNPHYSVVNLGVASYAPSIYYAKMAYLLEQGFTFKHVIVAVDIGDIYNEAVLYALSKDGRSVVEKNIVSSAGTVVEEQTPVHKNKENAGKELSFFEQYFKYTWFINLIVHEYFYPTKKLAKTFDMLSVQSAWTHGVDEAHYGITGVEGAIEQAVSAMTKLKKLLDAHDIKMSVLVYPWPAQLMYAPSKHKGVTVWEEFCKKQNCTYFMDANPKFYTLLEHNSLEDVLHEHYLLGDFHFNERGNAVVYEAIQESFTNK